MQFHGFRSLCVSFLALTSASSLVKRAFLPTEPCCGTCQGRLHDPSVAYRADTNTFYRFTTNDKITVATAPAISGPWTPQGPALSNGSIINLPGNQDLWAPDVLEVNGTYYMYYSVSQIGSQNSDIGVATSETMNPGSWTDHGSIGLPTSPDYNKIDANLFVSPGPHNSTLAFGSFWGNIFQVHMASPPLTIADSPTHIAHNTTARPAGLMHGAMEGAFQFLWGDYVYLFMSAGNCCDTAGNLAPTGEEYHIMVCRRSAIKPFCDYIDKEGRNCLTQNGGTLVLASHDDVYAPGGQGVIYDPSLSRPVIYYHYAKPSVSYAYDDFFFGWNKLDFSSGWPVVVA